VRDDEVGDDDIERAVAERQIDRGSGREPEAGAHAPGRPEHARRDVDADGHPVVADGRGSRGGRDAGPRSDVEDASAGRRIGHRDEIARDLRDAGGMDPFVRLGDVVVAAPVVHAPRVSGAFAFERRRSADAVSPPSRRSPPRRYAVGHGAVPVTGPAGVSAIVLAELTAGATVLLWPTPLWTEVKRGFFTLTGTVVLVLALSTWAAAAAGVVPGDDAGAWSVRLAAALAGVTLAWLILLLARRRTAARVVGLASVPVSVALLAAMAATSEGSYAVALFQLLAGAAFLGAVLDGLLLGHWYLTDRGLSRGPINRYTTLLIAAVVLEAAAVISGGFGPTETTADINPLLTSVGLAAWIALGMVGTTALIAILIRAALRGTRASAVQAATGFFYLAVITALTAEFAAKVRFLP
jgi:hypothetical protein